MKHVAVLTSGGDAPGMNAAIRAVVRCAVDRGWRASGVRRGFRGLVEGEIVPLGRREVGGVLSLGGTVLGSARYPQFANDEAQAQALQVLRGADIDGLVVIGGNGSQTGAAALANRGMPVVGVASTIDNDLVGTDITIGTDTALDVALESIDRLRTTAASHRRVVLVEVMGRDSGYLALCLAIAGGAEAVVVPEDDSDLDVAELARRIMEAHGAKGHALVVVAEGATLSAGELAAFLRAQYGDEMGVRATVLGHVQRGGIPTAFDRLLASRLGAAAVDALDEGTTGVLVGLIDGHVRRTPLADVAGRTREPDLRLGTLADVLAR